LLLWQLFPEVFADGQGIIREIREIFPFQPFSLSAFQLFSLSTRHLAAKPPFPRNYFHFCTSVKSVLPPLNSRIHNGLAGVETPIFAQKIVRTVRRRFFKTHATIAP
jgi:hypothetical protein